MQCIQIIDKEKGMEYRVVRLLSGNCRYFFDVDGLVLCLLASRGVDT